MLFLRYHIGEYDNWKRFVKSFRSSTFIKIDGIKELNVENECVIMLKKTKKLMTNCSLAKVKSMIIKIFIIEEEPMYS